MPRRFLITFENPVAVRPSQVSQAAPDGNVLSVDSVPSCPTTALLSQDVCPGVAKALMQRCGQTNFGQDQVLYEFLQANPLLVEGLQCLLNNREVPNEIAVALFQTDERLSAQASKVTFNEALKLVFTQQKASFQIISCCFGIDLRKPAHRQFQKSQQFQRSCANKPGIFKLFNYAAPDYLFSLSQQASSLQLFRNPFDPLIFRQQYLTTLITENLLQEDLTRFYSLKELASANVNLDDLLEPEDVGVVYRALEKTVNLDKGQKIRIGTKDQQKFLINQLTVPEEINKKQIIVLAVACAENEEESMLQNPCTCEEFKTYTFDQFDTDDYTVHVIFNLKPPKNLLQTTLEQSQSISNKRKTRQDDSDSETEQTKTTTQKNKRKQKVDLNELDNLMQLFPELFIENQKLYKEHMKSTKFQDLGISFTGSLLQTNHEQQIGSKYWFESSTLKNFNTFLREIIAQFQKLEKIEFGGEQLNKIGGKYLENLITSLMDEDLVDKSRVKFLFENPTLVHLSQGFYSKIFMYQTISKHLVESLQTGKFNIKGFVESLMLLLRGINHVLFHRVVMNTQNSYIELQQGHSIPSFYNAWGFTQIFGACLLQQADITEPEIMFEEYQVHESINNKTLDENKAEDQQENIEEIEAAPENPLSFLQYMTTFSLQQLNDQPVSQLPKSGMQYQTTKYTKQFEAGDLQRFVNESNPLFLEDTNEPGDHVYGLYIHPPAEPKPPAHKHMFQSARGDYEPHSVSKAMYQPSQARESYVEQLNSAFNSEQQQLSELDLQNLVNLSKCPHQNAVRLQTTQANLLFTAPIANGDAVLVPSFEIFIEKMMAANFNVQQFYQAPVVLKQEEQQVIHPAMLDASNCERVKYVGDQFEILIPKQMLKKKPKTVAEFIEMGEYAAFDINLLTLLSDLQKQSKDYCPGLVYSAADRQYYYLPLVLDFSKPSLSKQLNASQFEQAKQMQTFLVQQIMLPQSVCQANILSLVDQNFLTKKFQAQLKESIDKGYSCQTFIGFLGQQILEHYQFEKIIKKLLGIDENDTTLHIQLNDFVPAEVNESSNTHDEHIMDEEDEIYRFITENMDQLLQFSEQASASISEDEFCYLNNQPSKLQDINQFKNFLLCKNESYSLNVNQLSQLYAELNNQPSNIQINLNTLIYSIPFTNNAFNTTSKAMTSRNQIVLGRLRGLKLAQLLKSEKMSPDCEIVQCKKEHGFVSVTLTEQCYQALVNILNPSEPTSKHSSLQVQFMNQLQTVKSWMLQQRQCITFPQFFNNLNVSSMTFPTKILGPIFKKYSKMEITGQAELKDVYGRTLRSQSPYQLKFKNTVVNEPAPLEVEAPPQPAASGEEQTMQHLIDFWESVKNKFFCIPEERIRAALSPLFCLEEREIEFLPVNSVTSNEVQKQDEKDNTVSSTQSLQCKCGQMCAVMYPNPNPGLQLEQFQKGIYYMSPYYIPPASNYELERMKCYRQLVKSIAAQTGLLVKEYINKLIELPNSTVDKDNRFNDIVLTYFCRRWPVEYKAEHIQLEASERIYKQKSQDFLVPVPTLSNQKFLTDLKNFQRRENQLRVDNLVKYLDNYQQKNDNETQYADIAPLIAHVIQKNQLLDLLQYSDPDDLNVQAPLDVSAYLLQNKVSANSSLDEHQLNEYKNKKQFKNDEILSELINKQNQLKQLEEQNLKQNVMVHQRLQMAKYQDIHNETAELFCTATNAVWGKICQQDKANPHLKISYDQLALGGFETNGPKGDYSASKELDEMAKKNALEFGRWTWDKEGFDIRDIVDFD
ncbi:Conserved_hypothetical protein [Hexamita inflata]|uniref:Uncharacterized protein n=1 Tax=Hexamita inflata TaxID=28002 RepID=A0AA86RJ88_9EUKA|nr:Conserved hypothetical protein [Hexamita inflata]